MKEIALGVGLALAWGLTFWAYRHTNPPVAPALKRALLGLRLIGLTAVVLFLAEPGVRWEGRSREKPKLALLVDESSSMGFYGRAEVLRGLLEGPLRNLRRKAELRAYAFAREPRPVPWQELSFLSPEGPATDIGGALRYLGALDGGEQPDAVLLLSDGAHNIGEDPVAPARDLGVPVYVLGVGASLKVRNLQIAKVRATPIVYLGDTLRVTAVLRAWGMRGQRVAVELVEGGKVVDRREVRLPGDGEEREMVLAAQPAELGPHTYLLRAPLLEGEAVEGDNRRLLRISVSDRRVRVLFLVGGPSPDLAFLRRLWGGRRDFQVDAFVLRDGGTYYRGRTPGSPEGYDVVVLLDFPSEPLEPLAPALRRFVREGGGLLALGGSRAFGPSAVADLLPFEPAPKPRLYEGPFILERTPSGRRHPALLPSEEGDRMWGELPPLLAWNATGPLRADAVALAVHPGTRQPVMAFRSYGRGKVAAFACATFWRWDLMMWGVGGTNRAFSRIFEGLIRWLSKRALGGVHIGPENPVYRSGEPVPFSGWVYDRLFRPVEGATVLLYIAGKEVLLTDRGWGEYGTTLDGLPSGEYPFTVAARKGGEELGWAEGVLLVEPFSVEDTKPEGDEEVLRLIAERSGGLYFPGEEADSLLNRLDLEEVDVPRAYGFEVQRGWGLLLAAVLPLSVEWGIRRRKGML
ncbi:MAG TPA: hypothetical protein EYP17_02390 [Candidatus Latescibacteria bacterium]|nr:hypothetical protein [Candidatus Latescibacterota bacterium]